MLIVFFYERSFPYLVGQSNPCRDLNFNALSTPNMFLDPRTQEYEKEIERILHLNQLANRLPDSFNNAINVTKSHIHATNAHARPRKIRYSNHTHEKKSW